MYHVLLLNGFVAGLTALGLVLSALGFRAWFRYGESRLALLFLAFVGFFGQGLLLTYGLFVLDDLPDALVAGAAALSGASLLLVYAATLARPAR